MSLTVRQVVTLISQATGFPNTLNLKNNMKNIPVIVPWFFAAIIAAIPSVGCIENILYEGETFSSCINFQIYIFINVTAAIGLAAIALSNGKLLIPFLRLFGILYMLISGIGFIGMDLKIGEQWESVIQLNLLNYVHFFLGITLSSVGMLLNKHRHLAVACNKS